MPTVSYTVKCDCLGKRPLLPSPRRGAPGREDRAQAQSRATSRTTRSASRNETPYLDTRTTSLLYTELHRACYLQLVSWVRLDVRGELAREERVGKGGKRRLAEVCGRPVECVLGTTNICRVRRTPQVPVGRALDDAHAYVEVRPGNEPVVRLDGPRQAKSGPYTPAPQRCRSLSSWSSQRDGSPLGPRGQP